MGQVLFEHNLKAYEAALAMLREQGKAAVIHPTGTGKSFIAFQFCADFSDKTVCWLSPSAYIFHTQRENWRLAGGEEIHNVRFFTYAKLMLMEQEELRRIAPDYIILDEFHRCGAQMWGQGVQRLLACFDEVPVLGFSATNIRYLDGQRDMADELFDGNIASELTLGEAIVQGILQRPKYILSVYSWQKGLGKYEERVRQAQKRAVREEANQYLEALKRTLEKADGLEKIFDRHMEDRNGRYLVFCSDYDHMQEMMEKAPEWFAKVDQAPHIYSVYSEDPGSEEAFANFQADSSDHLKLLFCIDMLNEGVHVQDVSGVILLRPTVSPIIYKQQIGRALSAGGKKAAVIFDVVMNIENLYSIGSLEEEMQTAVGYYRALGQEDRIINEHFQVIDEVEDCLRLFHRLNDTLGASWDFMYEEARRYYLAQGNLDVPKRYKTQAGLSLGQWLDTQRKVRAGKVSGLLTEAQIARLDQLGMRWQTKRESAWERNFAVAKQYYEEYGNLLIGAEETYEGVHLGKWIAQMRDLYKKMTQDSREERVKADGEQQRTLASKRISLLTEERIHSLEQIGMVWDVQGYRWERNFAAAKQYYQEHGDLDVPYYYVDGGGIRLGAWLCNMRAVREGKDHKRAELTDGQIQRLEAIGMKWNTRWNNAWERSYEAACRYREEKGNLDIPIAYVTENGCRLGRWIRHQREAYRKNLSKERKRRLEAIGMVWDTRETLKSANKK